ncbi:MAG: phosphoribosylformylglycinamidine synthase subunit PurL, partial [Acidimicrobiales bacterium]
RRAPNHLELAMYSVMWSEHCSYKSSRAHLGRLPSEGEHVLVGPGENAGVVDVGDGVAVAVRIESHNHPSAVEPYQGAATGVGGILRDIFTMGARPIALMDPLFMGPLDDPRSRFIFDGVVRGIAGYGNSVGVPTVGGQLTFAERYRGNPLVNVLCLGVLPVDRLVLAQASGEGNLAVLLGSLTGRDGIGGVSVLASAGFGAQGDGADADKRPSVQVGDPYEEKRLIEACLDLLDARLVVGIQDLGGAGITCATCETASMAGFGMDVDVSAVPLREAGMTPVEIMTSESQERMLAIVEPPSLPRVLEICERYEIRAAVVGRVAPAPLDGSPPPLRIRDGLDGPVLAEVPALSLADGAPRYDRPLAPPADLDERRGREPSLTATSADPGDDLLALCYDPCFVYRQYDHQLFLNTVTGPGDGDATVLKLAGPGVPWKGKGLALSTDANPGWCAVDPRGGTAATVAESALNVACAGGRPIALVDCLNFGNPEHPEVMWQLAESIDGMAEACRALGIPVVGGNVSLYNESGGQDIDPTPVVGMVGVIDRLSTPPPGLALGGAETLVLLGETTPLLAGSRWARELHGATGGTLPALDLETHDRLCRFVRELVNARDAPSGLPSGLVTGIHDVSDGGLALCLAEMAVAADLGLVVDAIGSVAELFSESPSRVVISTPEPAALLGAAETAGIPAKVLGETGGDHFVVEGLVDLPLTRIAATRGARLPDAVDLAGR